MKTKTTQTVAKFLSCAALVALVHSSAQALTIVKTNNTTALNLTGSWVGGVVPGSGDTAKWDSTVTSANAPALGGNLTWGQIQITNPGGAVTIASTASTTLTLNGLGSPLTGIDMASATTNLTISEDIALGASQTWKVGASRTLTVSSVISGTVFGITKDGAGTLTLTGANTFSGGINVSAGTLMLTGANTFTGGINISGGMLSINNLTIASTANPLGQSSAAAANLLLGNGATLQITANSKTTDRLFTINGTADGDSATLDFSNSGTTAFGNGPVTFTGTGALAYGTANQTRTLNLTGTCSFVGSLAAAINNNGTAVVSVTKNGTGVFALTGNNTFSGGATVNTGVLSIGKTQARGTGTVTVTATGAVALGVGTGGYTTNNVASLMDNTLTGFSLDSAAGAGIDTTIGVVSYTLPNTGTRPFVKVGANTLTLTGNSTYGGPIKVYTGFLAVGSLANGGSASPLGQSSNAAGNLSLDGGTIQFNGSTSASTDRGFTICANGGSLDGSGTAAPTWSGPVAYDVPNVARTLNLVGSSGAAVTNVFSGILTNNGTGLVSLYKSGVNTWWLSNPSNNFTGGVSFNQGFLQFSAGALGPSGKIFIAANTVPPLGIRWSPGNSEDISSRFNDIGTPAFCTLDTGTNDVIFANSISMNSGSLLIKEGSGSLTLNVASSWAGATIINAGTWVAKVLANGGTASSIGNIPNTAIALGLRGKGATLKYVGAGAATDHNFYLSGTNTIDASGTGALIFTQTGAISPTPAARSFTLASGSKTTGNAPSSSADLVPGMIVGGTGITPGTKIVSVGINSQLTFDQNATASTNTLLSFGCYLPGTLTLTGSNTSTNEIRGILKDSVSGIDASVVQLNVTKAGVGKWILSGTNTYTGTTTLSAGTLVLGANNVLTNTSAVVMAGGILEAGVFTNNLGTLEVTGTTIINLGAGGKLTFADSRAQSWSGGPLEITGAFVSGSSIRFGTSNNGLTAEQKTKISLNGKMLALDANGYVTYKLGTVISIF